MSKPSRTAKASLAAKELIDMKIDRHEIGRKKKLLVLSWCAICGMISEPEARILLGRAGELTRLEKQGYFRKYELPPGLKASIHFPHMHYFHLTEKGIMELAQHDQELAQFGNLDIYQRIYLHDHICRIEAACRMRIGEIIGFMPEVRLNGKSEPGCKQPDGIFFRLDGTRIGVEVEAADWKSGDKLAQFLSSTLNSISSGRVQEVIIIVQTEAAGRHYASAFKAGKYYYLKWVKENGKWWSVKKTATEISAELSAKVKVQLVTSKEQVDQLLVSQHTIWMPSALKAADEYDFD